MKLKLLVLLLMNSWIYAGQLTFVNDLGRGATIHYTLKRPGCLGGNVRDEQYLGSDRIIKIHVGRGFSLHNLGISFRGRTPQDFYRLKDGKEIFFNNFIGHKTRIYRLEDRDRGIVAIKESDKAKLLSGDSGL